MNRRLTLVHTSDIHLGSGYRDDGLAALDAVIDTVRAENAHLLLLAGDIFDNNRVDRALVRKVAGILAESGQETVVLPGNHDCLAPDAVYREPCFQELPNVRILGIHEAESVIYDEWDIEVWGRPHASYDDMSPLSPAPPRANRRWHIGMAHGHFVRDHYDEGRSYLIRPEHLEPLRFDYIALGHWDVWTSLEHTGCPAYYSGSPHLARSVNIVHLDEATGVQVRRRQIANGAGPAVEHSGQSASSIRRRID